MRQRWHGDSKRGKIRYLESNVSTRTSARHPPTSVHNSETTNTVVWAVAYAPQRKATLELKGDHRLQAGMTLMRAVHPDIADRYLRVDLDALKDDIQLVRVLGSGGESGDQADAHTENSKDRGLHSS